MQAITKEIIGEKIREDTTASLIKIKEIGIKDGWEKGRNWNEIRKRGNKIANIIKDVIIKATNWIENGISKANYRRKSLIEGWSTIRIEKIIKNVVITS